MVRGCGPSSLHPDPARSYEQTRANRATPGCTRLQSTEKSPAPASRMTVGCALRASPVQFRCSCHPPTSTNRPGGGRGGEVVVSCACDAGEPPRSRSTVTVTQQHRVRSPCIYPPCLRSLASATLPRSRSREVLCFESGLARAIAIFPVVRDSGFAEHKAYEISEARLSPNIVGEKQHTTSTALQADEAVGGLPVVAAFVESAALGAFEHDDPQSRREVWPLFGLR